MEVWLKPNRRALLLALIPPLCLVGLGALLTLGLWVAEQAVGKGIGLLLLITGLLITVALAGQFLRPRLAYRDGRVLFFLRTGKPIEVPLEVVEAFFLGQAGTGIPGVQEETAGTVTLVARLSEKAESWKQRPVHPSLGQWCDGYVVIRGTWSEPLDIDVVTRLNRRLSQLQRETAVGKD